MTKKEIFTQIYDQYVERIYRFVFLKVNSPEIAEDITSETFLKGWKAFQAPGFKIENTSSFLYQIARNLVTDFYRQKEKFTIVTIENVTLPDWENTPDQQADLSNEMTLIRTALANLKDDYQDIIIWRYLDELSISEISKILDKSEGAVRTMLHRALQALKTELKNKEPGKKM